MKIRSVVVVAILTLLGCVDHASSVPNGVVSPISLSVIQMAASEKYLWFASDVQVNGVGYIGSVDDNLHVRTYALPRGLVAGGIALVHERVWFSEKDTDSPYQTSRDFIGVLDPRTGSIKELPIPTSDAMPGNLTYDDGRLFFAEEAANAIGEVRDGSVVEHRLRGGLVRDGNGPTAIVAGTDGIYFIEGRSGRIGELRKSGAWRFFSTPLLPVSRSLVSTPKRIWFTNPDPAEFGFISEVDSSVNLVRIPWNGVVPDALTSAGSAVCFSTGKPFIGCYDPASGFSKHQISATVGYRTHGIVGGTGAAPMSLAASGTRLWYASQVAGGQFRYIFGFVPFDAP